MISEKELNLPREAFVLLSIGELNKNKNHETVIKALAQIKNPNIYYLICGAGPLESHLNNLITNLNLKSQIKLLGFKQEIADFYNLADVFIFPSYREGLSVALMEAMSSRLPVICSNIRGNVDLIDNDKGGYLVEPEDVQGFSNAIKNLYQSVELREAFSVYNFEKIDEYTIEKVLKKIKELY
ncbi:glycosyltransferase [Planococcus faecalis]|nr:glycosyltransferase [Planococcus faecalis]